MSFLFGGGGASECDSTNSPKERLGTKADGSIERDPGSVDPAKIEMMTAELDMMTDVL